jgi:hypothetical protein
LTFYNPPKFGIAETRVQTPPFPAEWTMPHTVAGFGIDARI